MNIYTPGGGGAGKTRRVWDLADEISQQTGQKAQRNAVIAAYVAEGGNANTASTQYYYWSQAAEAPEPATVRSIHPPGPMRLRIDAQGRLTLPPDLLDHMQLGADGQVTVTLHDGELHLVTPQIALRKLQEMAQSLVGGNSTVVDDLIAERRRDAAHD
jgi:antitoxin component of MazEF toxin-antitoxin module